MDRARAARSSITAHIGTGEIEVVAQKVDQEGPGLKIG